MENLFENLELEQKEQFLMAAMELKYFTLTQWKAIYGIIPMSQKIFDDIQLTRLKVGEELESVALDIFLKYPVVVIFFYIKKEIVKFLSLNVRIF